MLNLTFPAITNGYISAAELQGTLSCQLNAMLMRKLILKEQLCFYPQRIPRSDFFDELFQHESEFFQLEFNKINDLFLNEILSLLKSSPEQIGSNCFNIMNIMMRRNCVESLYKLLSNFTINSNDFNARFLWETIKIELDLNLNRSITLSGYHCLGREILKVDPFAFTNAVQIANRIIVCAKRHLRKYDENNLLPYYKYCFNYLNSIKKDTFEQVLLKSKCHRGIAMIEYYGTSRQNLHLKKAENYARKLEPINEYENLIAKENLYTLLQTLSKWNFFLGNDIVAEKSLIEMCELDPLDSRAFSEYGLYLYKKKRFVKAEQYFSKAIELGPPSIGMNLYFLIKTKEALGVSKFDLISLLLQVIEIDPCTISPWIDIIEFYIEQGEKELCRNFVCKMFNNPQLKDQLNEQEVEKYSSFFN